MPLKLKKSSPSAKNHKMRPQKMTQRILLKSLIYLGLSPILKNNPRSSLLNQHINARI